MTLDFATLQALHRVAQRTASDMRVAVTAAETALHRLREALATAEEAELALLEQVKRAHKAEHEAVRP